MYVIQYSIASLVLLAVVYIVNVLQWKVDDATNRAFQRLVLVTFVSTVVDILCGITENNPARYPLALHWTVQVAYYVVVCYVLVCYARFVFYLTLPTDTLNNKRYIILFYIPYAIMVLVAVLTPITHFVFVASQEHGYERRPGVFFMYAALLVYVFIGTACLVRSRKRLGDSKFWLTASFIILVLVTAVIQFVWPRQLVQHAGVALSILLIFLSLQNPADFIDSVSHLYNRNSFSTIVQGYCEQKSSFAVLVVAVDDMDFFSHTFGSNGINAVLRDVAAYLKTIIYDGCYFYLGQGIFAVVTQDNSRLQIHHYLDLIEERFDGNWKNNFLELSLSVHLRVIECPSDADTPETILDVIEALTDDVRFRADRVLFASMADIKTTHEKKHIQQLVKTAIQENRLDVYYQPLWSTKKQCIIGAEALVRMRDENGNFVSPEIFIPMAEQDGSILRIGQFVFEHVCRFLTSARVRRSSIKMIDVNLSVAQCMQSNLAQELSDTVDIYMLSPSSINLEITETAAAYTPEMLLINMKRLIEKGFSFSLDDYGSGYAGINYILHLPFSMIKIDKDIVWSAMSGGKADIMLTSTVDMLKKLELKIVAEGVEDEKMAEMLTNLGCDYLQGYYYSKPISQQDFYNLIEKMDNKPETTAPNPQTVDSVMMGVAGETGLIFSADDIEELEELEEVEELEPLD